MAKAQTQTGSKAIRAVFADAKRADEEARELLAHDPDPNLPRDGINPGQWIGAPFDNMPPNCCIDVIGRDAEGVVYCKGATGLLHRIERWDMPALTNLFAPRLNSLMYWWPGFGKKKITDPETGETTEKLVVNRVERDKCMMAIINEAARRPLFDPNRQHRGTGGWQDGQGHFVWHAGGWLWRHDGKKLEKARPALHDGFLYTRQAATIDPWQESVSIEESPARRLLDDLRTWNWQRPYLDPLLVIGWIATAFMGGALKARPIIFTTGGAGVGKSRLHELVRSALDGVVVTSVNTTAAGIYQRVKQDSRPVMVDELENKAGSTRAESVIELARVAYTGGDISRGGQDHEATTFTARNSFFFSAIIPPPMGAQDKTRMAMLNLNALDRPGRSGRDMQLKPETDGRMLLRQVMDGWQDFQGRLLPDYASILGEHGLSARAIDTYGTLLAAAQLLVGEEAMEDCGLEVTSANRLGEVIASATAGERTENLEHWHKVVDALLQSTIDKWTGGEKPSVGSVVEEVLLDRWDTKAALERLQLLNLWIGRKPEISPTAVLLGVPMDGPMLQRVFADTDFQKGGWYAALKTGPRGVVHQGLGNLQKCKINGSTKQCLLVDLAAFNSYAEKL